MGAAPLLSVSRDGLRIKDLKLESEILVGREEGCVIRLEDRAISRQHALFRPIEGGVQLEKRSKFAPVAVNGAEVSSAILKDGDVIAMGPYQVRVSFLKPEPAPEVARVSVAVPPPPAPEVLADPFEVEEKIEGVSVESNEAAQPVAVEATDPKIETNDEPTLNFDAAAGGSQDDFQVVEQVPNVEEMSSSEISEDGATRILPQDRNQVRLILRAGSAKPAELDFSDKVKIIIGRGDDCDLVVDDKKASRENAIIERTGPSSFVIRDLESSNGTYVNEKRITEKELNGNDVIRIGATEFQFQFSNLDYEQKVAEFDAASEKEDLEIPAASDGQSASVPELPSGSVVPLAAQQPIGAIAVEPIPGITGIPGAGPAGKQTLLAKFRALPPRKQLIYGIAGIAVLWFLFDEEPKPVPAKKAAPTVQQKPASTGKDAPAGPSFEKLTPEQKRFIESQYQLAYDYFTNKDYDKSLFEVGKIFQIIPEYKDARDLERYAKEGKRRIEAQLEEKKKKEEEARLKARIAQLLEETRQEMAKKHYSKASQYFPEILSLDPENTQVATWQREIEKFEQLKQEEEERKRLAASFAKQTWETYNEAVKLQKEESYLDAIKIYKQVLAIEGADRKVFAKAEQGIAECLSAIKALLDPVIDQAKSLEESGELDKAYKEYEKAALIDPNDRTAPEGMDRIREILHERAKVIYTEAVLAESFSDFDGAKRKFQKILDGTPKEDIYFERAKRKIARYSMFREEGKE